MKIDAGYGGSGCNRRAAGQLRRPSWNDACGLLKRPPRQRGACAVPAIRAAPRSRNLRRRSGTVAWQIREHQRAVYRRRGSALDQRVPTKLSDAIRLVQALEPFDLFFLEDAIALEEGEWLRQLREKTSIPLAQGELFNHPFEWRNMIAEECKGTPAEWEPFLERIGAAHELGLLDKLFDALFDDVEADTPKSWNAQLDKLLAGLNGS